MQLIGKDKGGFGDGLKGWHLVQERKEATETEKVAVPEKTVEAKVEWDITSQSQGILISMIKEEDNKGFLEACINDKRPAVKKAAKDRLKQLS